jgi:hypothetical protein
LIHPLHPDTDMDIYNAQQVDARYSNYNNTGRDQHNYYITFVGGDNHFYSRETLVCDTNICIIAHLSYCCQKDNDDPGIDEYIVAGDCEATAIENTTTFVATNVSITAPYFGIPNCNSENLTVKMYVFVSHMVTICVVAKLTWILDPAFVTPSFRIRLGHYICTL